MSDLRLIEDYLPIEAITAEGDECPQGAYCDVAPLVGSAVVGGVAGRSLLRRCVRVPIPPQRDARSQNRSLDGAYPCKPVTRLCK